MVWCCVIGTTEYPIGLVTAASINTSEEDGENSGYFGGSCSLDQDTVINIDPVSGLPDDSTRYLGDDGRYYDLCGGAGSCTEEVSLTADFCLALKSGECAGTTANPKQVQMDLRCGALCNLRLKYVNEMGQPITIYEATDAKITSKNRTLAGGTETASFDLTFEIDGVGTYQNCFH